FATPDDGKASVTVAGEVIGYLTGIAKQRDVDLDRGSGWRPRSFTAKGSGLRELKVAFQSPIPRIFHHDSSPIQTPEIRRRQPDRLRAGAGWRHVHDASEGWGKAERAGGLAIDDVFRAEDLGRARVDGQPHPLSRPVGRALHGDAPEI